MNVIFYLLFMTLGRRSVSGEKNDSTVCTGPQWSCRGKCGGEVVIPCSCSPSCIVHQICCEDYYEYCEHGIGTNETSSPNNKHSLKEPNTYFCSNIVEAWLESGCKNQTEELNVNKCIRPNETVVDEVIPATDIKTKVHYRNIYCALCNDAVEVVPWIQDNDCVNDSLSYSHMNHCITQMKNPIQEQAITCISIRNPAWNHSDAQQNRGTQDLIVKYERQCNAFTSYVSDSNSEKIYRNRYCYLLDSHDNDSTCIPPLVDIEDKYCYENRHDYANQCIADVCSKENASSSVYCPGESFRMSMNMLFAVGNTDGLDSLDYENDLMVDASNVLSNQIIKSFKVDGTTTVTCSASDTLDYSIDIRGFSRSVYISLECTVGRINNASVTINDVLEIIDTAIDTADDEFKIPLKIEITVCFQHTTSYRKPSFYCGRTSFNITVIRVPKGDSYDLESYISIIGCILSVIGLLVRIILQFLVPYFQTLPGKIQCCLCCTLFAAYASFLVGGIVTIGSMPCYVAAIFTHWSFLSSLFWMNVIAFQIWRTFRVWHNQATSKSMRTLALSCLYAMGLPTLFVVIGLCIEFIYPRNPFSPAYGKYSCWMNKIYSALTWFVIPSLILSFVNSFFALLTLRGLRIQKMMVETTASNRITPVNEFAVSVRIVILVGVTWLLGLFVAFLESPVTWMLFTIFNSSLGLFISLVLICNPRVYALLKNRCFCPAMESFSSVTVNTSP